jgi:chorismate-pyruvate lyase
MGGEVAIDWALSKAQPRFSAAAQQPLGTAIFLSNSAKHDGDQYAWKIEHGEIDFRSVNPNADRVVERGLFFTHNRFKHIGRSQLAILRSLGV